MCCSERWWEPDVDCQPDGARHLDAVRVVARHSHEPKRSHGKAAQKILKYLLETAHLTLKFKQDSSVDVGTLVYRCRLCEQGR